MKRINISKQKLQEIKIKYEELPNTEARKQMLKQYGLSQPTYSRRCKEFNL